jgi:hypothetical protein
MALVSLIRLYVYLGAGARASVALTALQELRHEVESPTVELAALLAQALHSYDAGDARLALTLATGAWQLACTLGDRSSQAEALVIMGHTASSPADASRAHHEAMALYEELGQPHRSVEPRAGLAALALAQGAAATALTHVDEILNTLAIDNRAGLDEPFYAYLTCYQVLSALDDPRSTAVLRAAQTLLEAYAERLSDTALRRSFLENVTVHRAVHEARIKLSLPTAQRASAHARGT